MAAETIYALSSGAGRAAITVVRISGSKARFGLETLAGSVPPPRRASVRTLRFEDRTLDTALVLWLPGPATFTGEDMVELHCHGGRAVVASVLTALLAMGLRPADPGAFTRRALANGRMSLPDVEGLADLLVAETAAQHRQAMAQMEGSLTRAADGWRHDLVQAMALIEAQLDFSDEGDVADVAALDPIRARLAGLREQFLAAMAGADRAERIRDGLTVVLAGPVNAGKSTLLNVLAGRDVAIVTDVPGTTRDMVEVRLDLGGVPVTVVDTAGLRDTDDPIEREGIRRARERAAKADLVLYLRDASDGAPVGWRADGVVGWTVLTKIDSVASRPAESLGWPVSARTGEGLSHLVDALTVWAAEQAGGEPGLATRARHVDCLRRAVTHVDRSLDGLLPDRLELAGEDLRLAVRALDKLIGRVDVEQVLDSIFATFCIGK